MYWLDLLFSSLLGYAWLGLFSDRLFVPHTDALPILTPLTWKCALLGTLVTFTASLMLRKIDPSRFSRTTRIVPAPFILLMAIGVWTDFPERRDSFPLSRIG